LPLNTVHGVLKARIMKWFSIPFSSGLQQISGEITPERMKGRRKSKNNTKL